MKPAVSCVVPHYRQHAQLTACLAALNGQQGGPSLEVVVVDDGSEHRPILGDTHLDVRLLSTVHRGPATARNVGAAAANSPILAFTDADCRPRARWIAAIAHAFADSTVAAVVGPLFDKTPIPRGFGLRRMLHQFMQSISVLDHNAIEITYDGFPFLGTIGANFAVSREWFEHVGGFDERFTRPGGEDYDLGYRLQKAGAKVVFVPDAIVEHHYATDLQALIRRWIHYGVGKSLFATKHDIDAVALDLVCSRWFHLITRLPTIYRVARAHYPSSVTKSVVNSVVRYYVEWLFQLGAVRGYRAIAASKSDATRVPHGRSA